ncbi:MAG: hypothetical protein JWO62_1610 [Acidimicrobiaceae bacterium]|nr:hypothetical protein [Acidimicrobiaceae bacterium]
MGEYSVKESGSVRIAAVVLSADSLRALAELAFEAISEAPSGGPYDGGPKVKMVARGPIVFEGATLEMLKPGGPLDSKQVLMLSVDFGRFTGNYELSLKLKHVHNPNAWDSDSTLSVSGTNSVWVHGTLRKFEEFVKTLPEQTKLSRVARIGLFSVIFAPFCLLAWTSSQLVSTIGRSKVVHTARHPSITSFHYLGWSHALGVVVFGIVPVVGELLAYWGGERVKALYPNVEFQTGPEHLQIERQRRRKLGRYVGLGVIPLILGVITGLIDTLLLKL